jgi:hypothetical protein
MAMSRRGTVSKVTAKWMRAVLRPGLAMSVAMNILSFAMIGGRAEVRIERVQQADLNPVKIWERAENKVIRMRDRAVKSYEDIRMVYQLEQRLKDLEERRAACDRQQELTQRSEMRSAAGQREARSARIPALRVAERETLSALTRRRL